MDSNPFESPAGYDAGVGIGPGTTVTLKRLDPVQAAKVAAVTQGLFSCIVIPFVIIAALMEQSGASVVGIVLSLLIPVFYAVIGFIAGLVGGFIYNVVAGIVGGFSMTFE